MQGYGVITNLDTKIGMAFQFNPDSVSDAKKINYIEVPNIGGSSREKLFTGFENNTISFKTKFIEKNSPIGVTPELDFMKSLREPSAGLFGIAGSFFGNENYPPPKVLYGWGTGNLMPLVWDVDDVSIDNKHFKHHDIQGVIGVVWYAEVSVTLSLDEDSIFNKANQMSKKANQIVGSINSIGRQITAYTNPHARRERNRMFGGSK